MLLKNLVSILFVGILSIVNATNIEGFRNLKWGDSSSKLTNKKSVSQEGHNTSYIVLGDNLSIGSAKVKNITYDFYKNRFYRTQISFDNRDDLNELVLAIKGKFNLNFPCKAYPYSVSCFTDDGNGHNIEIVYSDGDISGKGTLRIFNSAEYEQQQREPIKGF